MSGWWIADLLNDPNRGPAKLVSWVVLVIGSIVLHELAHGWAALKLGDTTPRDTGHMTWNPLVHMGPWSLAAFAVIGIAWGMMPVDPTRLRGRRAEAWVALAGPATNIAIAAAAFVLLILWEVLAGRAGVGEPLMTNFVIFFRLGVWLNIVLAVFNLLPVLPLDGGRIAANLSRGYRDLAYSEHGQWIMLGGFILFFWFGFDPVAAWSMNLLAAAEHAVLGLF